MLSGSCPGHLTEALQEHQLDLIEQLSTKLIMLKDEANNAVEGEA